MIKEKNRIKIWRANSPIKDHVNGMVGTEGDVWIYADDAFLNDLCSMWPADYLRRMERMQEHLKNQVAFSVSAPFELSGTVVIAGLSVENGLLSVMEFFLIPTKEGLLLNRVEEEPSKQRWLLVKREARRTH